MPLHRRTFLESPASSGRTGYIAGRRVRSPRAGVPFRADEGASTLAYCTRRIDRAIAAGPTVRPLADTVAGGMAWSHSRRADRQAVLRAGITLEREVLAAWHTRKGD